MSNDNLKLSVVIGAAFSNTFGSIVSDATTKLGKVANAIKDMGRQSATSTSFIEKMRSKYLSLESSMATQQNILQKRAGYRSQIMDVVALGAALYAPIKSASNLEQAMLGVKQVMDFQTPDGLKKLKDDIVKMSLEIPLVSTELANIAARGAANLVPEEKLKSYTEIVSKAVVAWGKDATETSNAAGAILKSWGKDVGDLKGLFDMINQLGNKSGGADAGHILESLRIASANARNFGLKENELTALTATLASLKGVTAVETGSSISKLLQKLMEIPTLSDKAKFNLKKMQIFPEELQALIKTNPSAALMKFLEKLEKVNAADRPSLLKDVVGGRNSEIVSQLVQNLDLLKKNIATVSKPQKYQDSLGVEYKNVLETAETQIKLLTNSLTVMSQTLGDKLLPSLKIVADSITGVTSCFVEFDKANPGLVSAITKITGGLIGLRLAAFTLGFASTFLFGGLNKVIIGIKMLAGSGPLLLITAATLIVTHWKQVKEFCLNLWDGVKTKWDNFANWGINNWAMFAESTKGSLLGIFVGLTESLIKTGFFLKDVIVNFVTGSETIQSGWRSVKNFFISFFIDTGSLFHGFLEKMHELQITDKIIAAWTKLKEFFKALWKDLTPSFDMIMEPFKTVGKSIQKTFPAIGNLFNNKNHTDLTKGLPPVKNQKTEINKNQTNNYSINVTTPKIDKPEVLAEMIGQKLKNFGNGFLYDEVGAVP